MITRIFKLPSLGLLFAALCQGQVEYTTSYAVSGGTFTRSPSEIDVLSETPISLKASPLVPGDTFDGWYPPNSSIPFFDTPDVLFLLYPYNKELTGRYVREIPWGPLTSVFPSESFNDSTAAKLVGSSVVIPSAVGGGFELSVTGPALVRFDATPSTAAQISLDMSLGPLSEPSRFLVNAGGSLIAFAVPHGSHRISIQANGAATLSNPRYDAGLAAIPHPATGGTIVPTSGQVAYAPGELETFTAEPAAGWVFLEWYGDVAGTKPMVTVPVLEHLDIRARFAKKTRFKGLDVLTFGPGEWTRTEDGMFQSPVVTAEDIEATGIAMLAPHSGDIWLWDRTLMGLPKFNTRVNEGMYTPGPLRPVSLKEKGPQRFVAVQELLKETDQPTQWRLGLDSYNTVGLMTVESGIGGEVIGAPPNEAVPLYSKWPLEALPDPGYRFARWETVAGQHRSTSYEPKKTIRAGVEFRLKALFNIELNDGLFPVLTSAEYPWSWDGSAWVSPVDVPAGEYSELVIPDFSAQHAFAEVSSVGGGLPYHSFYSLNGGPRTGEFVVGSNQIDLGENASPLVIRVGHSATGQQIKIDSLSPAHAVNIAAENGELTINNTVGDADLVLAEGTEVFYSFVPFSGSEWSGWSGDLAGQPISGSFILDGPITDYASASASTDDLGGGFRIENIIEGEFAPVFFPVIDGPLADSFPSGALGFGRGFNSFETTITGPGRLSTTVSAYLFRVEFVGAYTIRHELVSPEQQVPTEISIPVPAGTHTMRLTIQAPYSNGLPLPNDQLSGQWGFYALLAPLEYRQGGAFVSLFSAGNGTLKSVPSRFVVFPEESIDVEAVPAPGWRFDGWRGDWDGLPAKVLIDDVTEPIQSVADFVPDVQVAGVDLEFPSGRINYDFARDSMSSLSGPQYDTPTVDLRWTAPGDGEFVIGWNGSGPSFFSSMESDIQINDESRQFFSGTLAPMPLRVSLRQGDVVSLVDIDATRGFKTPEFIPGYQISINQEAPANWAGGVVTPIKDRYDIGDTVTLSASELTEWTITPVFASLAIQPEVQYSKSVTFVVESGIEITTKALLPSTTLNETGIEIYYTGTSWTEQLDETIEGHQVFYGRYGGLIGFASATPKVVELYYKRSIDFGSISVGGHALTTRSGWQRLLLPIGPDSVSGQSSPVVALDMPSNLFLAIGRIVDGQGSLINHPWEAGMVTHMPASDIDGEALPLPFDPLNDGGALFDWESTVSGSFAPATYDATAGSKVAYRASRELTFDLGDGMSLILPSGEGWDYSDLASSLMLHTPDDGSTYESFEIQIPGPGILSFRLGRNSGNLNALLATESASAGFTLNGEALPHIESTTKSYVLPVGENRLALQLPPSVEIADAHAPARLDVLSFEPGFELLVRAEGPGSAIVIPRKELYAPGETVEVFAQPIVGAGFLRWEGVNDEAAQSQSFVVDDHSEVVAYFSPAINTVFGLDWTVHKGLYRPFFSPYAQPYLWESSSTYDEVEISTEVHGPVILELASTEPFTAVNPTIQLGVRLIPENEWIRIDDHRIRIQVPEGSHTLTLKSDYRIYLSGISFVYERLDDVFAEWIRDAVGEVNYWSYFDRTQPDRDFDGDGLINLAERELGLEPASFEIFMELLVVYDQNFPDTPQLMLSHRWPDDPSLDLSDWEFRFTKDFVTWEALEPHVINAQVFTENGFSWRELSLEGTVEDWNQANFGLFYTGDAL